MDTISTRRLALFSGLGGEKRMELEQQLARHATTVDRGAALALRGDEMRRLLILLAGNAHAEIVTGNGHVMVVENFIGPDVIALAVLFGPDPHYPVSVIADSICRVSQLEPERLLDLCQQDRSVLEHVLKDSGRRVAFLAGRLRMSQFASLRQKIAVYILEKRHRTNQDGVMFLVIPHSRQELADIFGVARPSLSREMGRLCDEGILCADGNRVSILDPDALTALATGCE
jgi:CRP/FNR family transcriptional regulator, dissimilatory nitrate respiration regulator